MMELFSSDLPTNGGYIITGGPGTGKTSVLKEIAQGGKIHTRLVADIYLTSCTHYYK